MITHYVVVPLRYQGRIILVKTRIQIDELRRGDRIAYHVPGTRDDLGGGQVGSFQIQTGIGYDAVLGLPRDEIQITEQGVTVGAELKKGLTQTAALPAFSVPPDTVFVWPDSIRMNRPDGISLSAVMDRQRKLGLITQERLLGRSLHTWIGRNLDQR